MYKISSEIAKMRALQGEDANTASKGHAGCLMRKSDLSLYFVNTLHL